MFDLLANSCWALETRYYNVAKAALLARLEQGLPAFEATEARPRGYAHVDADGFPTMWVTAAGELAGLPAPEGHGLSLASGIAGVLAGRSGGSAGSANTSGSKVAVIPVQGAIKKYGGLCSLGTKDLVAQLAAANRDPEISAIVLDVDSPGGQVDGTEEFAQAVALSGKPVVAYIDGLGASAAYWIAAQASTIFVNSASTGYVGSLGVLCMYVNQSKMLDSQGIEVEIMRSTRAVDKARLNPVEKLSDEVRASVQADLDQIGETFISAVQKGRAGKLSTQEDVFTGKVYTGAAALKNGLADKVGSLQDAVNHAAQLAQSGGGKNASLFTQHFQTAWHSNSPTS